MSTYSSRIASKTSRGIGDPQGSAGRYITADRVILNNDNLLVSQRFVLRFIFFLEIFINFIELERFLKLTHVHNHRTLGVHINVSSRYTLNLQRTPVETSVPMLCLFGILYAV